VSRPSSVCNTGMGVKDFCEIWFLLLDELLELCDFAHLFECENLVSLVTVDCQTS